MGIPSFGKPRLGRFLETSEPFVNMFEGELVTRFVCDGLEGTLPHEFELCSGFFGHWLCKEFRSHLVEGLLSWWRTRISLQCPEGHVPSSCQTALCSACASGGPDGFLGLLVWILVSVCLQEILNEYIPITRLS